MEVPVCRHEVGGEILGPGQEGEGRGGARAGEGRGGAGGLIDRCYLFKGWQIGARLPFLNALCGDISM